MAAIAGGVELLSMVVVLCGWDGSDVAVPDPDGPRRSHTVFLALAGGAPSSGSFTHTRLSLSSAYT